MDSLKLANKLYKQGRCCSAQALHPSFYYHRVNDQENKVLYIRHLDEFTVLEVFAVGHEDEEDSEHDVAEVGVDLVPVLSNFFLVTDDATK
jgi:hypothetical protein